jgi:hypothetical protein
MLYEAFTLTQLPLYQMLELLLIIRINHRTGLWGILNSLLERDKFLYWVAREIAPKEEVLSPLSALQTKIRTPPPHFC